MLLGLFYAVNLILYLLIGAIWIAIPEEMVLNLSATIFNVSLSVLLLLLDRKRVGKYYHSSWFRNLRSATLSVFLIFCILGLINYLSFKRPWHWDISKDKVNSLTEQSIKVLKRVEEKIIFRVFDRKEDIGPVVTILDLYRFQNSQIEIIPTDVELSPALVKEYNITAPGTVIVEYRGRKEYVLDKSELAYTNAIIRLTRERDPVIYYTVGHGEPNLDGTDKDGLHALKERLLKSLYDVQQVNIATLPNIPDSVDLLMVWGPKTAFFKSEITLISNFITRGGKLLIALDPDLNSDALFPLRLMLQKKGIRVVNDLVVDKSHHVSGNIGTVPIVKSYHKKHPITERLTEAVFFPLVSSVEKLNNKVTLLAFSSKFPSAWAERNPREIIGGKVTFHKGKDKPGPVAYAAAWEANLDGAKIVVFGSSTFVINSYKQFVNNFNLVFNSLSWLTDSDLISSFNLAVGENKPIMVSKTQLAVIFYFGVVFCPLCLLGVGFVYYRRRRKL